MRVHLTNAGAITLCESSVFDRLDVLVDPQSPARLEQAIARIGSRDGAGHVRLSPSVLRFLSDHAGAAEWEADFNAMIGYAASKGWLDDQGRVRAHLTFREADEVVSESDFKSAMRALPAGISAVTCGSGDEMVGMIVSSLTSISADPPMVGFFAHQNSSIRAKLLESGRFAANVLGEEHHDVISTFLSAPQGLARFANGSWAEGDHQVPVLTDALASMECDIVCTHPLGTHDLIVGKIRKTACSSANPVVHFNAATHSLVPVQTH
ncbi:NADH-dependent flavin reductase [Variovorax sp. PBL-E5]|nr:NADH-dependent flavin reductase [Variovorax sp. PBL-E5]